MGSSRKKKEKQKDFQKAKLRVGKGPIKATNHTDVSFVAKSIHLPNQNVGKTRDQAEEVNRYISLLKHYSSGTRKESLIWLKKTFSPGAVESSGSSMVNVNDLIHGVSPLILDTSQEVRNLVYELLASLAITDALESQISFIMLYINSAMTHISPEIRNNSTKFLSLLLKHNETQIIRIGWIKLLDCFLSLLGWNSTGPVTLSASVITNKDAVKTRASHLACLKSLLESGLLTDQKLQTPPLFASTTKKFLVPDTPMPFTSLHIISAAASSKITEDVISRRAAVQSYSNNIQKGLNSCIKEGGEIGRIASSINELITT